MNETLIRPKIKASEKSSNIMRREWVLIPNQIDLSSFIFQNIT